MTYNVSSGMLSPTHSLTPQVTVIYLVVGCRYFSPGSRLVVVMYTKLKNAAEARVVILCVLAAWVKC